MEELLTTFETANINRRASFSSQQQMDTTIVGENKISCSLSTITEEPIDFVFLQVIYITRYFMS